MHGDSCVTQDPIQCPGGCKAIWVIFSLVFGHFLIDIEIKDSHVEFWILGLWSHGNGILTLDLEPIELQYWDISLVKLGYLGYWPSEIGTIWDTETGRKYIFSLILTSRHLKISGHRKDVPM